MNRLKLNVVKDHPKSISGGGGSMTVMSRKVAANNSGGANDSSVGPRILNNFSLMKRRIGCCDEIVKDMDHLDAGARTISLGDKLFGKNYCYPDNPYLGKSYGCGDNCGTVKKVAVAQDYTERMRRLKTGADTERSATSIENVSLTGEVPEQYYLDLGYTFKWILTWAPIPNGEPYHIALIAPTYTQGQAFEILTPTSGNLYTKDYDIITDEDLFIVRARVKGCNDITGSVAPCFLQGALVSMADGSTKAIEDIRVGDMVLGAFGEHNEVLALHRPLLGNNTMTNINNDHHTSSHHPHISADKKFYAVKPALVMSDTYGKSHEVLDENMVPYQRFLAGLKPGRVQQMELGVHLKSVDGTRDVMFLDTYEMAPETQLYNLVISGSHTYFVDGYAVTGWPNEEDFDYDAWAQI